MMRTCLFPCLLPCLLVWFSEHVSPPSVQNRVLLSACVTQRHSFTLRFIVTPYHTVLWQTKTDTHTKNRPKRIGGPVESRKHRTVRSPPPSVGLTYCLYSCFRKNAIDSILSIHGLVPCRGARLCAVVVVTTTATIIVIIITLVHDDQVVGRKNSQTSHGGRIRNHVDGMGSTIGSGCLCNLVSLFVWWMDWCMHACMLAWYLVP